MGFTGIPARSACGCLEGTVWALVSFSPCPLDGGAVYRRSVRTDAAISMFRSGGFGALFQQSVNFLFCEHAPGAGGHLLKANRPDAHSREPLDFVAQREKHQANLALHPLAQHHFEFV